MKVGKEALPQREVVLNIEVEDGDLSPYLERAYQRLVQRANIPGFRKGKAPRAVVERFVGRDALVNEAMDFMVPELVDKAIAQEQVEQGDTPHVDVTQTEPIVLKATVPLVPTVVLDAYRDIRVTPEPVEVSEEHLGHILEDLRWAQASWEPVERPVAVGDQVTMDVRGTVGGKEATNQKSVVYLASEENPSPVPGFAQALAGAAPAGMTEFTLTLHEDYPDRRLAGQECMFQVTVHEVKEKRLSELDDEFAKGVGDGYDSLEALTAKIREDLLTRAQQAADSRYQDAVTEELVKRATLDISPLVVEHEVEHLLHDEQEALGQQRIGMEQYLETVGKSTEEHREDARVVSTGRLTRAHALAKVAELEGLTASDEDVDQEIDRLVERAGASGDAMRRELSQPEARDSLSRILVRRWAVDRLVSIAKGEEVGTTAPAAQEPAQESSPGGTEDAGTSG